MDKSLKLLDKNFLTDKQKNQAGFTLIELAIVIIIGGLLVTFMASALFAFMKKSQLNRTEFRIEKIEQALADYLSINGRYPCPASRFQGPEDGGYAQEVTTTSCNAGAFNGTTLASGVRIGAVPTRALNMPDEFISDAWQQKFTYAVTGNLATPNQYSPDGGLIRLEDGTGNSLVTPAGRAHYVLLSHGETGDGSFPESAATVPSVPCSGVATVLDRNNCNNTNLFINTLVSSDNTAGEFFDDFVVFKGQTVPIVTIPPDVVIPFNRTDCPPGWSQYAPAQGRFVVGAQAAPKSMPRFDFNSGSTVASIDLAGGTTDNGDGRAIFPPYTALLYCEEN